MRYLLAIVLLLAGCHVQAQSTVVLVNQVQNLWGTVAAVAVADVDLADAPATIDGVTLATGDRVLLTGQTDPVENGVYLYTSGTPDTLARPYHSNNLRTGAFATLGAAVTVEGGTDYAGTEWYLAETDGNLDGRANSVAQIDTDEMIFRRRGDVTSPVANSQLASVDTATIKGRITSGTGAVEDLTASQVRTLLNVADGANAYVLPAPTTTVLGGVKRNTGTLGQFVTGIDTDGALLYGSPSGSGTVTSVAISGTDGLEIDSGSPITGSGTIVLGIHAANLKTHLSLGDAASKNTGTTAGTVAAGDDARLSDARTPTAHASSHVTGGSDKIRDASPSQDGLMTAAYAAKVAAIVAAIFYDAKTSGTNGGTFTSGAWQTRALTASDIPGDLSAILSGSQITLPAGTYLIRWSAPAYNVNSHQSRLWNVTAGTSVGEGSVEYARASTPHQTRSMGSAIITIGGSTAFRIEHRCQTTAATNGFGVAASFGTEVYTEVSILRLDQ